MAIPEKPELEPNPKKSAIPVIFSPSNIFYPYLDLMAILLVISYFIVFVYFVRCKSENHEYFILGGTFVLILTVLLGLVVSVLVKPIFVERYIVPSLGVFWLTFAFLLTKSWNYKKIFVPILIVALTFFIAFPVFLFFTVILKF